MLLIKSVIPAKRAARRAGTYFEAWAMSEWVPDRAHLPSGEIISGASGMTMRENS
jgi:hypothetical protein